MSIFLNKQYGRNQLTPSQVMKDPVLLLAFGFGSGLAKKAPGTMGTLAAIPVYYLLMQTNQWIYGVFTVVSMLAGVWICGQAADKLGEHDFGGIVWDEIAGYLVTMWLVPFTWQTIVLGFVLFRVFDIIKPWPIKWLDQHVDGGFGIMVDDILAGIFAALVMQLILSQGWLGLV